MIFNSHAKFGIYLQFYYCAIVLVCQILEIYLQQPFSIKQLALKLLAGSFNIKKR